MVQKFLSTLKKHSKLRSQSLNLVASENIISTQVRLAMANDMSSRYSSKFYGGTKYIREIIELTTERIKELFNADYACIAPISGHLCVLAAVNTMTEPGQMVSLVGTEYGGYPVNMDRLGRYAFPMAFDEHRWDLDYEFIPETDLMMLGSSVMKTPISLDKIKKHIATEKIVYDGSHVLGLIAGGQFQNPLEHDIPLLFGSTHKSFPGPQGGIIVSNNKEIFEEVEKQFSIQTSSNPFNHGTILVDNIHPGRIAALGVAALEMLEFGEAYASQIITNGNTLGHYLENTVLEPHRYDGTYTYTHQLIIRTTQGEQIKQKLEQCNIFVDDFIRIGLSEVTRMGANLGTMRYIAELIKRALDGEAPNTIKSEVKELTNDFDIHYSLVRDL